jgi:hypothetical protein
MKVLFVGEGPHDIGRHDHYAPEAADRPGVVQVLARKVCPHLEDGSPALRWSELARFHPDAKKRGFAAKMKAAAVLAERRYRCVGIVCVTDRDRDDERVRQVMEGADSVRATTRVAYGIAVESIEAWTLGAPSEIASELELHEKTVRAEYPNLHVEELYERSGREEHQPKSLLARIAALVNQGSGQDFRVRVAERTDVARLERACPKGFAPFAESLREAFADE